MLSIVFILKDAQGIVEKFVSEILKVSDICKVTCRILENVSLSSGAEQQPTKNTCIFCKGCCC